MASSNSWLRSATVWQFAKGLKRSFRFCYSNRETWRFVFFSMSPAAVALEHNPRREKTHFSGGTMEHKWQHENETPQQITRPTTPIPSTLSITTAHLSCRTSPKVEAEINWSEQFQPVKGRRIDYIWNIVRSKIAKYILELIM